MTTYEGMSNEPYDNYGKKKWDCLFCGHENNSSLDVEPECEECGYEDDWGEILGEQDDWYDERFYYEDDGYLIDGVGFSDPGGRSALRAATPDNPRVYPCPTCHEPNKLTGKDVEAGYQCDACADRAEGLMPNAWY